MTTSDYADLKYSGSAQVSHWVPFGDHRALCGKQSPGPDWYGTGSMDEYDKAFTLPLCVECEEKAS